MSPFMHERYRHKAPTEAEDDLSLRRLLVPDYFVGNCDCVNLGDVGIVVSVEEGCGPFVRVGGLPMAPLGRPVSELIVVVFLCVLMLHIGTLPFLRSLRALAVTSLTHGHQPRRTRRGLDRRRGPVYEIAGTDGYRSSRSPIRTMKGPSREPDFANPRLSV